MRIGFLSRVIFLTAALIPTYAFAIDQQIETQAKRFATVARHLCIDTDFSYPAIVSAWGTESKSDGEFNSHYSEDNAKALADIYDHFPVNRRDKTLVLDAGSKEEYIAKNYDAGSYYTLIVGTVDGQEFALAGKSRTKDGSWNFCDLASPVESTTASFEVIALELGLQLTQKKLFQTFWSSTAFPQYQFRTDNLIGGFKDDTLHMRIFKILTN